MGLREYRRKRDFKATPEPPGKISRPARASKRSLAFVIQKHAASRLHYDFRLELDGTLKSWAVPKGPSLDPADKRLAMHVEDHPLEYGDFEGTIPKGEYGGGTVLVWDRGTWEPIGDPHKGYREGNLKFALKGDKLQGAWALVRIRGRERGDNGRSWLLIKERDAEARSGPAARIVDREPKSAATGRTLDEVTAAKDRVWHSNRDAPGTTSAARKRRAAAAPAPDPSEIGGARPSSLPKFVTPELATLVDRAPGGEEWLHEMKYDGYRILARIDHGRVTLASRNGRDWTANFPTVTEAAGRLPVERAILDGEVAVLLPKGTTSFQALQNFLSGAHSDQLVYMVFDLLHLNGRDLTGARLDDRKSALAAMLESAGHDAGPLRYSDHVVGNGPEFFAQACRLGLEGIISKRRDSPYRGTRSREWLKIKCVKRQEVVIGGYTDPEGSRVGLGALLGGVHEDGRLVYVGKIGTGFSDKTLRELKKQLVSLEQEKCPFATRPIGVGRPHWVKPRLVGEVSFSEWTDDGRMRHPAFLGLRADKPATSVVREVPAPVEAVDKTSRSTRWKTPAKPSGRRARQRT
jgi:bifunctional non-homologous end joining protein LigD